MRIPENIFITHGGTTMSDKRIDYEAGKRRARKYVRYREGAAIYNMGLSKFSQLAREANAVYKIDGIVLVNTEIFDRYLEGFRLY